MDPIALPTGRPAAPRAPLGAVDASTATRDSHPDAALEAVAHALRGARARTGMSEQLVVDKLAEDGFVITVARLRAWERTGVIRVDAAARLADAYGTTLDSLSGRRAFRALPGSA